MTPAHSLAAALLMLAAAPVIAQDYDASWHTVDGGGHMSSVGGIFAVGGTVGQPDAGSMTGGIYEVVGGFWPIPASAAPCAPCDTNCDGSINLFDIESFVAAITNGVPSPCSPCLADTNADGSVNLFDIEPFVQCLTG